MSTQLISIIIPVYNGENYLSKLIESLLNNPYENIEILIGNDCSSDRTKEILERYKSVSKIKVLNFSENIGPGAVRNKLISLSSGQFLALQDVDDSFNPSRFLEQVSYLIKNPDVGAVGTGALFLDKTSGQKWGEIIRSENPGLISWLSQTSIIHASLMFRREFILVAKYREDIRLGEDYYFLTELFCKKVKFRNIGKSYYYYYVDREDLKTRGYRRYKEILQSIFIISTLFPFYLKIFFLSANISKLGISYVRGKIINSRKTNS